MRDAFSSSHVPSSPASSLWTLSWPAGMGAMSVIKREVCRKGLTNEEVTLVCMQRATDDTTRVPVGLAGRCYAVSILQRRHHRL